MLIDHTDNVWKYLQNKKGNIIFIMDNAGFELVCDLFLADAMIRGGLASTITFHFKAHPT
jgi:uncharacterized protein with ATP-grasp and redox domains